MFKGAAEEGFEEAFGSPSESSATSETVTRARMLITSTKPGLFATPPGSYDALNEGHLAERKMQASTRWAR